MIKTRPKHQKRIIEKTQKRVKPMEADGSLPIEEKEDAEKMI